ncbi:pyruvate kinase [Bartonella tribocorum]|nr:pyruvate kinase [Bartonella tribocorum]
MVFFHASLNRLQEQRGCGNLVNVPIDQLLLYLPLWKLHGVWLSFGGFIRVVSDDAKNLEDMVDRAAAIAFQEGFCQGGDRFLVTAGVPLGTPGATNLLRIASVSQDGTKGI